jgi:hypothetical protein
VLVEENRKIPVKEEKKTKEKNSKHEGKRKREGASLQYFMKRKT